MIHVALPEIIPANSGNKNIKATMFGVYVFEPPDKSWRLISTHEDERTAKLAMSGYTRSWPKRKHIIIAADAIASLTITAVAEPWRGDEQKDRTAQPSA